MAKHIVQYEIKHIHRVQVGIEAATPEEAVAKAEAMFYDNTLWSDTSEVPLLMDDFEEYEDGYALEFEVIKTLADDEPYPAPDASIVAMRRNDAARRCAEIIFNAYQRGEENGGSIDWSDIDEAYRAALEAVGSDHKTAPTARAEAEASAEFQGRLESYLRSRIEDGNMYPDDIPTLMVRYGLMNPKDFIAEMEERMSLEDE